MVGAHLLTSEFPGNSAVDVQETHKKRPSLRLTCRREVVLVNDHRCADISEKERHAPSPGRLNSREQWQWSRAACSRTQIAVCRREGPNAPAAHAVDVLKSLHVRLIRRTAAGPASATCERGRHPGHGCRSDPVDRPRTLQCETHQLERGRRICPARWHNNAKRWIRRLPVAKWILCCSRRDGRGDVAERHQMHV
jgi:hypothetical protein